MNKIFESGLAGSLELYDEIASDEEFSAAGNSFFERSYFGTRVLILAANFGDEITLAGNMMLNLSAARAEIFVAYSAEKVHSPENINALKILGVPREKIIFIENLKRLIVELRANIIFCVEAETAAQKKLSAAFEKILGEILRETPDYRPEVYKKFACATALNAPPDFYASNLMSVRRPKIGVTDGYDFDVIDRAGYGWAERVRFPVPEACRKTLLKNNPLAVAIFAYRKNHWSALRICNSDEVFFERRTDNQAFFAQVTNPAACDFQITGGEISRDKILAFDWSEEVQVRRVVIYGNFLDNSPAKIKIRLTVDSGAVYLDNVYELPSRGRPLIIDTEKIFVRRAEIKFVEGGRDFGIAEVEFFANVNPLRKIAPFVKLVIGEDFFYRCDVPYEVEKIPLGLYKFHVDEPVRITAKASGETILSEILNGGGEIILNLGDAKEIALAAEVIGAPDIYDEAVIRRVSDLTQIQLKIGQWLDKMRVHKIRKI
ncbi:MAG: hypothetical protein J5809_00810 [Selenomonadaceae bacterium]|nr:hypothetical protein [Selenomonadaceae bacterium]